jgi:hypothetical protein
LDGTRDKDVDWRNLPGLDGQSKTITGIVTVRSSGERPLVGCGLASSGTSTDVGADLEWEVDLIKVGLE